MLDTPLDFDINLYEIPVNISGKAYILKEATGDVVCKYKNAALRSTKTMPDGKMVVTDGMADIEPYLVSMCLFEKNEKGQLVNVNLVTVRNWPYRIVNMLFQKAKKISNIDDDSIETIEKRIKEDTELLNKMKQDPSKEEMEKN